MAEPDLNDPGELEFEPLPRTEPGKRRGLWLIAVAGVLAAGLDGMANKRDPGKRLDINMYEEGHRLKRVKRLPLNMLDAVRLFDKSKVARERLGEEFVSAFVKLKLEEWSSYARALSQWERDHTLDC